MSRTNERMLYRVFEAVSGEQIGIWRPTRKGWIMLAYYNPPVGWVISNHSPIQDLQMDAFCRQGEKATWRDCTEGELVIEFPEMFLRLMEQR